MVEENDYQSLDVLAGKGTHQEQSSARLHSVRGWSGRESRQRVSGRGRSGCTRDPSQAPSPGPETTVRRPVWRQDSALVRERVGRRRGGFIILLIFFVPSQGTGRCMYRIPGCARAPFCGVGPLSGGPHQLHSVLRPDEAPNAHRCTVSRTLIYRSDSKKCLNEMSR